VTDSLPITPDTKVAQLLEAYPELVPARAADRAAGRPRLPGGGRPLGQRLCDIHRAAFRRVNLMEKAVHTVG